MKKIFSILLILLSLAGASLLVWKLRPISQGENLPPLPPLPPNLSADVSVSKISLPSPVPILMYHHISPYPEGDTKGINTAIIVSPENFAQQMQWLADHNFQTVTFDYLTNPTPLTDNKKPIILTFDDGYQDAFDTALPILNRYNFKGTFFLVVNEIGKSGILSVGEISKMQKQGMDFGSHTLTHPDLTRASQLQAEQEIYASKILLEQKIGQTVSIFCYPGGLLNATVENIVANSGYKFAATTVNEINSGQMDPLRLDRLDIRNDTDFETLDALKNI